MKGLLLLLLPALGVLLFFFPKTVSIIACIPWAVFLLYEVLNRIGMRQTLNAAPEGEALFDEDELPVFKRYSFFFTMPHAAMGISDAASMWLFACIPWGIVLGFKSEWAFMVCPLFVFATAWYLVARLHPVLYLSQDARRNPILVPVASKQTVAFLQFFYLCKKCFQDCFELFERAYCTVSKWFDS